MTSTPQRFAATIAESGARAYVELPFDPDEVWGAKDRIIPPWHAVIGQQGFPGCRVELFEGAGHFPHLEQPDRFARVLAEFMQSEVALSS